jgi:hypothetical protein
MGQGFDHPGAGQQLWFLLLEVGRRCLHVWQYSQAGVGVKLIFNIF